MSFGATPSLWKWGHVGNSGLRHHSLERKRSATCYISLKLNANHFYLHFLLAVSLTVFLGFLLQVNLPSAWLRDVRSHVNRRPGQV
jgi:hypothetical protein